MDPKMKMVMSNVGRTIVILIAVNVLALLFQVLITDLSDGWSFGFKHGAFFVNGKQAGLAISSFNTRVLMAVIFLCLTISDLRRMERPT